MRQKLFRALFGLGMLGVFISTVLLSILFYNAWKEDFKASLLTEVQTIAAYTEQQELTPEVLARISHRLGADLRLTWINAQGVVLYDSNSDISLMENHKNRPEIKQALLQGEGSDIRDSATLHEVNFYEALRLSDGSVLRVSRVGATVYGIIWSVLPGAILLLLLMILTGFFLARWWTTKMLRPIEAAVELWTSPEGSYPHSRGLAIAHAYKEVAPLLAKLDSQKNDLEDTVTYLEEERNTLRFMMEEMAEGILLADASGQVLAYNEKVKEIFSLPGEQNLQGLGLGDICHEARWLQYVKDTLESGKSGSYRMEAVGRYFELTLHMTSGEECRRRLLIVVADITEPYLAQQRRHEFTSNVSHELKTPLTTISGYAEVLANGMWQKKSDVTDLGKHIFKAARHMLGLIDSIMKLARLEETGSSVSFAKVQIEPLIREAWEQLRYKWEDKTVNFVYEGKADLMLYGNDKLVQEVFLNLFDNAIKFSREEKNTVQVKAEPKGNRIVLVVSDCGIGISKEKVGRIFERFYQTDESRNSKRDGSGIGLALVKHIVEIHQGTIAVKSVPGQGTAFTLTFPAEVPIAREQKI